MAVVGSINISNRREELRKRVTQLLAPWSVVVLSNFRIDSFLGMGRQKTLRL
jgi:hypothetical protein